ncbi:MAG TPA: bifunctional hydroxymethylpyrimidine kinase/phosphomethylpyrimidine kinase [Armatimonadota bacterium]|nr:bifunctional hydroxymethylpyrimidine kinase/phosphomethylpyrimidine kinase [Armatimonadota bacterium]HOS42557.1 bifunctional hydroxymethylpyrimidine kinase/phosphomethylpyrimidine kinase [Armatimonadota bacterium]
MHPTKAAYPCALTIAGSDSGGGAGIQADLKTFAANGVYGASVITALTAQNTTGVRAIHTAPTAIIAAQMDAVLEDLPIGAIKIGMLSSAAVIRVVADRLRAHAPRPLVLDPVMVAKSGDPLLHADAIAALTEELLPLAALLTPNLPEAARLLGLPAIADAAGAARALHALGPDAVLLKGGHAAGEEITDLLALPDGAVHVFRHPRLATPNTHGTGCSLSSAIAAGLAKRLPLPHAVEHAITWLHGAIAHAWPLGAGHGPVHHFWQLWPPAEAE